MSSKEQNRMKPVDMESAMVVTDYLFSELNTSADFSLRKNTKTIKWTNGIENQVLLLT